MPNDEMKTTVTWGGGGDNFLYIHGVVLTIGILFLIFCLAHVWHGAYFLSQLSEKGHRFLPGLFLQKLGLKV